jgi:hypothetical protein
MNDLPTLYRLADGTQADPGECSKNDKGVLCHQNGVPVVIDSDGKPLEIKREAVINKAVEAADAGKNAEVAAKAVNDGEKTANDARADLGMKPVEPPAKPADDGKTGQTL